MMNKQHRSSPSPLLGSTNPAEITKKGKAGGDGTADVQHQQQQQQQQQQQLQQQQQQQHQSHHFSPLDALVETEKLNRRRKGRHWTYM
jgi:transcription initiation factor TFIID subunit TAF12